MEKCAVLLGDLEAPATMLLHIFLGGGVNCPRAVLFRISDRFAKHLAGAGWFPRDREMIGFGVSVDCEKKKCPRLATTPLWVCPGEVVRQCV